MLKDKELFILQSVTLPLMTATATTKTMMTITILMMKVADSVYDADENDANYDDLEVQLNFFDHLD